MSSFLKGNFETKKKVEGTDPAKSVDTSVEARFEREALKRLGGSIAFVSRKKVMWDASGTLPDESKSEGKQSSATPPAKATRNVDGSGDA